MHRFFFTCFMYHINWGNNHRHFKWFFHFSRLMNNYVNSVLNLYVKSLQVLTSCPYSLHEFIWTWTRAVRRRPKAPWCSETADAPVPASDHPSNKPSHMWSSGKTDAVFPFVKSSCWTAVSFTGSIRKEVDIKVTVLFMCIAWISVEAAMPSYDSDMNNETWSCPSLASHLPPSCTFLCTSPLDFMLNMSVFCCLWEIHLNIKLTFCTKMINNMDNLHQINSSKNV